MTPRAGRRGQPRAGSGSWRRRTTCSSPVDSPGRRWSTSRPRRVSQRRRSTPRARRPRCSSPASMSRWPATWSCVAVLDRPLAQWVYEADDPRELVSRYAVMMGELGSRAAPIYDVGAPRMPTLRSPSCSSISSASVSGRRRSSPRRSSPGAAAGGRTLEEARHHLGLQRARAVRDPDPQAALVQAWRYVAWSRNALLQLVLGPPA